MRKKNKKKKNKNDKKRHNINYKPQIEIMIQMP